MEENLTGILTNRKDADDACRGVGRATVEVGHLNLSASIRRERERGGGTFQSSSAAERR